MKCTVKNLLRAYKIFKDNPNTPYQVVDFPEEIWTWKEFHDWFMDCLHNKINVKGGIVKFGRCYTREYEISMRKDKRIIHNYINNRIRHSNCCNLLSTKECKQRYPYIDNQSYENE